MNRDGLDRLQDSTQQERVADWQRTDTALADLLRASLAMWRVDGTVRNANDKLQVTLGAQMLSITRAPADLPFRWMIAIDDRTRGAMSVAGILRIVRQAAGVAAPSARLRVASLAVVPPE